MEPVKTTREQVQSVFKHTDGIKNTVTDNYNEFRDRTDCKYENELINFMSYLCLAVRVISN